jgi:hypothetical protein
MFIFWQAKMLANTNSFLLLLIVLVAVGQSNAALRTYDFTIHSASRAPGMLFLSVEILWTRYPT